MDDRFRISKYSAVGLIIIGLSLIIMNFLHLSYGIRILIFGLGCTLILSNLDKYLITGLVIWGIGMLFAISHWPYNELIILIGSIATIVALFFRFKKDNFKNYKLWIWISLLLFFISYHLKILLISCYFNIPRLDYSLYLFNAAAISLLFFYSLRFSKKSPKYIEDILKLIFVYSIMINYMFMLGHYPGYFIIKWILNAITLGIGVYVIVARLKIINSPPDSSSLQ